MKPGSGWGKGDAVYACSIRTGNCTNFQSYFIALARAVGIPVRFAISLSYIGDRWKAGKGENRIFFRAKVKEASDLL